MAEYAEFAQGNFSPTGDLIHDLDEDDEYMRNDTQVLNLEDGPQAMSVVQGSTAEDESYPHFDQDTLIGEEQDEEPEVVFSYALNSHCKDYYSLYSAVVFAL